MCCFKIKVEHRLLAVQSVTDHEESTVFSIAFAEANFTLKTQQRVRC